MIDIYNMQVVECDCVFRFAMYPIMMSHEFQLVVYHFSDVGLSPEGHQITLDNMGYRIALVYLKLNIWQYGHICNVDCNGDS
jgi:hypothetical protein